MTSSSHDKSGRISATEYPALQDFLGAYFHEDFVEEYGSPEQAASQFCEDAGLDEIAQTSEEWKRLLIHLRGRSLPEWQTTIEALGGAWRLQSQEQLVKVGELLAKRAGK